MRGRLSRADPVFPASEAHVLAACLLALLSALPREAIAAADAASPTTGLTAPAEAERVTAPTLVSGTADATNLEHWRRGYRSTRDDELTWLSEGSSPVVDGEVGQFDPTLVTNGQYRLVLEAWDKDGALERTVQVAGAMKIGHFSILCWNRGHP